MLPIPVISPIAINQILFPKLQDVLLPVLVHPPDHINRNSEEDAANDNVVVTV